MWTQLGAPPQEMQLKMLLLLPLYLTSLKRVREVRTDGCLLLTDACHAPAGAAGAHVDAVGRGSAAAQAEDADSQREQRC